MKTTTIACDRCKAPIKEWGEGWESIERTLYNRGPTKAQHDLCAPCARLVVATIEDKAAAPCQHGAEGLKFPLFPYGVRELEWCPGCGAHRILPEGEWIAVHR